MQKVKIIMLFKESLLQLTESSHSLSSLNTLNISEQNQFIEQLLEHMGSIDSQLRDDLIYTTWNYWITQDILSKEQLNYILSKSFDDQHLYYKLGEQATDSVFTRSFSLLLIAVLIEAHHRNSFIAEEHLDIMHQQLIHYMLHEKDSRGYVEEKGWAHAIAHGADVIESFAKSSLIASQYVEWLKTIRNIICLSTNVYVHFEDERLARACMTILNANSLTDHSIENWICSFTDWNRSDLWHQEYIRIFNVKNFLSCLYFKLIDINPHHRWASFIRKHLKKMMELI